MNSNRLWALLVLTAMLWAGGLTQAVSSGSARIAFMSNRAGNANIYYSSCALQRIRDAVGNPTPLRSRGYVELL